MNNRSSYLDKNQEVIQCHVSVCSTVFFSECHFDTTFFLGWGGIMTFCWVSRWIYLTTQDGMVANEVPKYK